jgi:hypothetical protein
LITCKAAAAILDDQQLLEVWMVQAAATGIVKQPLLVAAEHKWWQICFTLLGSMEFVALEHQHTIALWTAMEEGELGFVRQLLEMAARAEEKRDALVEEDLGFHPLSKSCPYMPRYFL